MFRPLVYVLQRTIGTGDLKVVGADGRVHEFGDRTGTPIIVRITDKRTEWRLALSPSLGIGEAYMDGRLILEKGTIYDFLEVLLVNVSKLQRPGWLHAIDFVQEVTRRLQHYNPVGRSKQNVAYHYDIDGSLYDLFLDPDRQYSCAYFEEDGMSLDDAQIAKKRHIASKLNLSDGMRVLDIGSGWGGLALILPRLPV